VSANFDIENDRHSPTRILFVDDEPRELEGLPAMDWGEHRSARALLHWQLPMMPPFRTGPTEDGFPSLRPLRLCGASREPNSTQKVVEVFVSLTEIAQRG